MADTIRAFVLTTLCIDGQGNVANRNVGVTFDLFEAEAHRAKGVENEFEVFAMPHDWREDAEQSGLISAMRDFRDMVAEIQAAALR